jgi:hypothetical protein
MIPFAHQEEKAMNKSFTDGEPVIAIGVIGPKPLVDRAEEALKSFPTFVPHLRPLASEEELLDATSELLDTVEVLLFSEYRGYKLAQDRLELKVPAHYVPLMGTGLYRSLFRLNSLHGAQKLSIDSVAERYVKNILEELGENNRETVYFPGPPTAPVEEIVRFHRKNALSHPRCVAMTGNHAVAMEMEKENIPHEWVTPTLQDLIVALERALLSTETRRIKEAQIVVGLIQIDNYRKIAGQFSYEHDIQRLELDLHRLLLDYVKQLDGHLTNLGGGEYLFFTTRGIFERETRGYKYLPLLEETHRSLGITLSIGIGFGRSATDAGTHARMALRQSTEFGGNICFIVREDRSVIGPVEMTHPMIYELSITDESLLREAEKAGMSAIYMSKLAAQIARYGKTDYTAHELAAVLGITIRSAHRILLQWIDAQLVDIVGEEKVATRGRPRQIYRLTFVQELMRKRNLLKHPDH